MKIKTKQSKDLGNLALYHISFNSKLEGIWDPEFNQKPDENHPEVADPSNTPWYPEPNLGRISTAPSIPGCFVGVFPNVSKFFEEKKFPHMNFYVYTPVFKGSERVVEPETLTKDRLVWDAIFTGEHLILDEVYMRLVGEIEILNTNKLQTAYIYPFGDRKEPLASVGPGMGIDFRWVKVKSRK